MADDKKNVDRIDDEIQKISIKLNEEVGKVIIKKNLPLRVKLLNKVICNGFAIKRNRLITIFASFNNKYNFEMLFSFDEIKEYLD